MDERVCPLLPLLVIPSAKLTLNGDTSRLVLLILALSKFLNSFKVKALSAATFCSSIGLSTRFFPVLGMVLLFLQAAIKMNINVTAISKSLCFIKEVFILYVTAYLNATIYGNSQFPPVRMLFTTNNST